MAFHLLSFAGRRTEHMFSDERVPYPERDNWHTGGIESKTSERLINQRCGARAEGWAEARNDEVSQAKREQDEKFLMRLFSLEIKKRLNILIVRTSKLNQCGEAAGWKQAGEGFGKQRRFLVFAANARHLACIKRRLVRNERNANPCF